MFRPIQDRVVILEDDNLLSSTSSIILVQTNNKSNKSGKVISVGSEVENIKPGDCVIFTAFTPNKVMDGDKTYYIMREPDILAFVKEDENAKQ